MRGNPQNLRPAKPGERPGGRQKGTPNKTTASVKAAIQAVFDEIGGVEHMTTWAAANPGEFYTKVYPKLLPLDVAVKVDDDLAQIIADARKRAAE